MKNGYRGSVGVDKRFVLIIAGITLLLLLVVGYKVMNDIEKKTSMKKTAELLDYSSDEPERSTIYYNGASYSLKENVKTLLLLGIDKTADMVKDDGIGYRNRQQSDFLVLLVIDEDKKACDAIMLNRDTMTDIQRISVTGQPLGTFEGQLALSHTYGTGGIDSLKNSRFSVSNLLYGVKIDHCVSILMDAVPVINDACGGVTVTLIDDYAGKKAGEELTLTGEASLDYVRARSSLDEPTNIHRMDRQKGYVEELYNRYKKLSAEDENLLPNTLLSISEYMQSDCTYEDYSAYANSAMEYGITLREIEGKAVKGEEFMEFYADDEYIEKIVVELFYEEVQE